MLSSLVRTWLQVEVQPDREVVGGLGRLRPQRAYHAALPDGHRRRRKHVVDALPKLRRVVEVETTEVPDSGPVFGFGNKTPVLSGRTG